MGPYVPGHGAAEPLLGERSADLEQPVVRPCVMRERVGKDRPGRGPSLVDRRRGLLVGAPASPDRVMRHDDDVTAALRSSPRGPPSPSPTDAPPAAVTIS